MEKAIKNDFDIIIMDYQLPGMSGAEAVQKIVKNKPAANILALSNYNEYMYIDKMRKAGVKGFVLKNISPEEMITAFETILGGKNYYSNDVALRLLKINATPRTKKPKKIDIVALLSEREMEILELIAAENTTEQIAQKLNLSKRTVDAHRRNLLAKMDVKNTAGLVKLTLAIGEGGK